MDFALEIARGKPPHEDACNPINLQLRFAFGMLALLRVRILPGEPAGGALAEATRQGARMMAKVKGNHGHGHSDAVAFLEGLGQEGAKVELREHEGGYTRYWLEGGEVRSCDITEGELPLAGSGPVGGPLPALHGAVQAEFGPQLPKLAADLASGAPDLDSEERVLRDSSLCSGATALKILFEQLDEALPPPECTSCGKLMCLHQARKKKAWLTRLGRVEVERS